MSSFSPFCNPPDCVDDAVDAPVEVVEEQETQIDSRGCPIGFPGSPRNILITSPFIVGALDIRFDDPRKSPCNGPEFKIIGVNVWKSMDSPSGPWQKINDEPISALEFRDYTKDQIVYDEDVTQNFIYQKIDQSPTRSLVFRTSHKPIVRKHTQNSQSVTNQDIEVKIYNQETNSMEIVPVAKINAENGEVTLISTAYFAPIRRKNVTPLLPNFDDPNNKVTITYRWGRSIVTQRLYDRVYYKVTTVATGSNGEPLETPLDAAGMANNVTQQVVDYRWQEALRYNKFILEEGGEWVKIFLKKRFGKLCSCFDSNRQKPLGDCLSCYATGFQGGYEGPFDILMSPIDSTMKETISELGRQIEFSGNTFIQNTPIMRPLDIIIRQDGTRYLVNTVKPTLVSNTLLQQDLSIELIQESDIRYQVPVYKKATKYGLIPPTWDGTGKPPQPDSPIVYKPKEPSGVDNTGSQMDPNQVGTTPRWAAMLEDGESKPECC